MAPLGFASLRGRFAALLGASTDPGFSGQGFKRCCGRADPGGPPPCEGPLEQRPAVLLIHDGELAELARLVAGLDVELQERVGAPTGGDRARSFDLALGSPRRLIELEGGPGRVAARIAALAGDSRTARAMLARSGIRLLV